ncbi:hypothetical protein OS493_038984 [Desmophyllum pertusum]|uniref:Uncharacterized protein n=1 Tax=Desmophyllum pertusum TaxID=174260 RepID=A0A9X0D014_9CNID|nr:hypothetical protein OS493_038984 [Desmophyllum pertusum]
MVVCVHTPLQEVVEIMRPTTAEISAANRGVSQPNTSTSDSTNGNSSAEMNPDLQVPPDSSWLIHCSSVVECLRNLACLCLKDDDIAFTICALKLLEEIARAMYAEFSNTQTGRKAISKDQILQFWLKLLDGPLIGMIQEGSSVSAPSCSAAVDCLSNVGAVIFNETTCKFT